MSTIPGNSHARDAESTVDFVNEWMGDEGWTDATMLATVVVAHTQATLALAYEQRTANLIAAVTATFADGSAMLPPPITDAYREEIIGRLAAAQR